MNRLLSYAIAAKLIAAALVTAAALSGCGAGKIAYEAWRAGVIR